MDNTSIFDYSALKERIIEKYGGISNFADKVGISVQALSRKLISGTPFKSTTICRWAELLDIKPKEWTKYFFMQKVEETKL